MGEPLQTDHIVSADCRLDIGLMNANGDTHDHLLWSLTNQTMDFEKVGFLKGLVTEEVVIPVSLVVDNRIESFLVVLDDIIYILCDEACICSIINVRVQFLNGVRELVTSLLVKVGDSDSGSKLTTIWVEHVQVGSSLGQ